MKHHFSLLSWRGARGAEGRHFQGIIRFPRLSHHCEELDFSISHQIWKIHQGKWSAATPTKNQKRWRRLVLHTVQWSTANYPAVHRKLNHKTICGSTSCSKMTKKMRQWPKRPRNLPWPPKSVPAEIRNDERQVGYFLCPLVTVDFVTKWSTAAPAGTKVIIKDWKDLRDLPWPPRLSPLESSDHHSPALRWSLLLTIIELRKHGLEVGESIYSSFIWSAATEKVLICWEKNTKNGKIKFN